MKKTIFTFFVACNLAMSGFFAVLATSPALAAECPLCEAVENGSIAEVRRLLDDGADPNHADADGFTALIYAAIRGHTQIAKALLDSGANPNQTNAYDRTALIHAALAGHSQTAKVLLDGGANPNHVSAEGATALMYAVLRSQVDVVKILSDTSDSSWLFATCIIDEMTDDKSCIAYSHPVSFSDTNAAKISYLRRCATGSDSVAVDFNNPQFFDINDLSTRSLSFLVRGDDKPAVKMQFSTSNLFLSKWVNFYDPAEAIALIKRSNNVRIRFPFRRGSEVIKFPMNGATAAIEKTREECKK